MLQITFELPEYEIDKALTAVGVPSPARRIAIDPRRSPACCSFTQLKGVVLVGTSLPGLACEGLRSKHFPMELVQSVVARAKMPLRQW